MPLPHVDVLLSCLRLQQPHVRPPLMLPPCRGSPHSVPPPALALPMYTQGQHPHSSQVLTSYTTHIHTHNFLTSLSLGYLCTVQDSSVAQSCLCDPHGPSPTRLLCPRDSPGKSTGVGCHFLLQCMKVESESEITQLCLTLRDPMDCSPPGSSIHGIFRATLMEWGAIAFSPLYTILC